MNRPGPAQWMAAGTTALALHAAVLMAFLMHPPQDGSKAPGLGGISVAVSMTATRAGAETEARAQQALSPPETPLAAPEEAAAVTATTVQAVTETVPEVVPAFEPPPAVTAKPAEVVIAQEAPPPEPKTLPKPPEKPAKALPKASPAATASPPQTNPAKKAVTADRTQQASHAATASQGRKDNGRKGQSSDERDAIGGGPVGTPAPNYINVLRYWLERNKTYPKNARRHRMQGVVHLYFRVTRDGRVLAHEIRKTSSHSVLDHEAEAMLERAQPLPKFTDDMKGGYLDVVVPVLFSLRGNS
ncbi:MAG: TonB family protein [Rhodospirillales bacterium]